MGYGPLVLDVEPGKLRELTPEEVKALRLTAEGKLKPKRWRATAMLPGEGGRSVGRDAAAKHGGRPARPREQRPGRAEPKSQGHREQGEGGENRPREPRGAFPIAAGRIGADLRPIPEGRSKFGGSAGRT